MQGAVNIQLSTPTTNIKVTAIPAILPLLNV